MPLFCRKTQLLVFIAALVLGTTFGCANKQAHTIAPDAVNPTTSSPPTSSVASKSSVSNNTTTTSAVAINAQNKKNSCIECASMGQEKERGKCYKLEPGRVTKVKKGKKFVTVKGRCQPQCIPYARCRSGYTSCRLGDTSPIGWYYCAQKNGDSSDLPIAGSLMVIGVHKDRGMPTGHLGYVEEVCPNADGTYSLRFSHTNYDRQCHLDLDAKVIFNPKKMEANFVSGYWQVWAKNLKILGFITK